jgi:hypothetical protein
MEIMTRLGEELSAAVVGVKKPAEALASADEQIAAILKRDGYRT